MERAEDYNDLSGLFDGPCDLFKGQPIPLRAGTPDFNELWVGLTNGEQPVWTVSAEGGPMARVWPCVDGIAPVRIVGNPTIAGDPDVTLPDCAYALDLRGERPWDSPWLFQFQGRRDAADGNTEWEATDGCIASDGLIYTIDALGAFQWCARPNEKPPYYGGPYMGDLFAKAACAALGVTRDEWNQRQVLEAYGDNPLEEGIDYWCSDTERAYREMEWGREVVASLPTDFRQSTVTITKLTFTTSKEANVTWTDPDVYEGGVRADVTARTKTNRKKGLKVYTVITGETRDGKAPSYLTDGRMWLARRITEVVDSFIYEANRDYAGTGLFKPVNLTSRQIAKQIYANPTQADIDEIESLIDEMGDVRHAFDMRDLFESGYKVYSADSSGAPISSMEEAEVSSKCLHFIRVRLKTKNGKASTGYRFLAHSSLYMQGQMRRQIATVPVALFSKSRMDFVQRTEEYLARRVAMLGKKKENADRRRGEKKGDTENWGRIKAESLYEAAGVGEQTDRNEARRERQKASHELPEAVQKAQREAQGNRTQAEAEEAEARTRRARERAEQAKVRNAAAKFLDRCEKAGAIAGWEWEREPTTHRYVTLVLTPAKK